MKCKLWAVCFIIIDFDFIFKKRYIKHIHVFSGDFIKIFALGKRKTLARYVTLCFRYGGEKTRQGFREHKFSYVTLDDMWYMYNVRSLCWLVSYLCHIFE